MLKLRRPHFAAALTCAVALVAGCGDDSSDTGGGSATKEAKITGAKVIDPGSMDGAKGGISFCTGKDTTGSKKAGVEQFNSQNPEITVKLFEFPESAKSDECDVFYSDVIWTRSSPCRSGSTT